MTEINPITELTINDGEKDFVAKAKGTFYFDQKAKDFAEETTTEDGKTVKTAGFTNIYNRIIDFDQSAILDFWECAVAYLKTPPTREQLQDALDKVIAEKEDTIELLQGALDIMHNSGFFKRKARQFWTQINLGTKVSKEEDKEMTETGIEMLKDNFKEIMMKEPY